MKKWVIELRNPLFGYDWPVVSKEQVGGYYINLS